MNDEYWTTAELRRYLKLEAKAQERTWYRVRKYFAPALVELVHLKRYQAAKVRELMEGRFKKASPLSAHHRLRRVS